MKRVAGLIPMAALVLTMACGQTDAGITTNVKTKLAADDTVKAYQVDVDTRDRVVTLSGAVNNLAAKRQAVLLAREADGVRDVVDNIIVDATVATSGVDIDDRAGAGIREGADDVGDTAERVGDDARRRTADLDDDAERGADKAEDGIRKGAEATADGAKKVGSAAKRGAEAVADGAKRIGSGIKDAVTDDDPDSDNDGK